MFGPGRVRLSEYMIFDGVLTCLALSVDCPLGPGETETKTEYNFTDVTINFGYLEQKNTVPVRGVVLIFKLSILTSSTSPIRSLL